MKNSTWKRRQDLTVLWSRPFSFCFLIALGLLTPAVSNGQTNCFSYTDFASTNGLVLTGNAAQVGGILRLTTATAGQLGNVWQTDQQESAGGFDTRFQFQITASGSYPGTPSGGDGISFGIQSVGPADTDYFGVGGCSNCTAVFFNTFYNWPGCNDYEHCDLSANSVGIMTNGVYVAQANLDLVGINLKDGTAHSARIMFDGIALTVWLDDQVVLTNVPTPSLQSGSDTSGLGWVGFSALTGWAWENHDILNWSFCSASSAGRAPFIFNQPANQTVTVGGTANFSVLAGGSRPLSYQWTFNGANIDGATANSLTLTNVQRTQAGIYAVAVSNAVSSLTSSNASLAVNFPPATVRLVDAGIMGGTEVTTPIVLLANGNENAVGFSLNFNPTILNFVSAQLGSGATTATLLVNTNQGGAGKIGLALALPTDAVFGSGTQELIQVTFASSAVTNATSEQVAFGDSPIGRQISDPPGNSLPENFIGGTISLTPTEFEADVTPRPTGDRAVTITDWVLIGRFAAQVDSPTNPAEFQRADCAPRSTFGNGAITVSDWVQAGRYAAGLDPLTPAGGPDSETPLVRSVIGSGGNQGPRPAVSRQLQVANAALVQGQSGALSINLYALGDENAVGFSLSFDPSQFTYVGTTLGSDAHNATLNLNSIQASSGRLACVLALPTGASFASGKNEVIKVILQPALSAVGSYPILLLDQPVQRETSDPTADVLETAYANGTVIVNPLPALRIFRTGTDFTLAWPETAAGFNLQETAGGLPAAIWSDVAGIPTVINGENRVNVPAKTATRFFRLYHP